jgi:acyl-CoA synthetase (AMP-forming)/AMP-acid ligase II
MRMASFIFFTFLYKITYQLVNVLSNYILGGLIGMGAALVAGATVVLRKKFSASNFWKECIQYNCTTFIYVGEICRFLVNQPVSEADRKHNIRKAFGNGLRENVWKEFYSRFGIKCVEFYAASEGNCTMGKIKLYINSNLI